MSIILEFHTHIFWVANNIDSLFVFRVALLQKFWKTFLFAASTLNLKT